MVFMYGYFAFVFCDLAEKKVNKKPHIEAITKQPKLFYHGGVLMSKCPRCGYHAFNGYECFDCGYKSNFDDEDRIKNIWDEDLNWPY